MTPPTSYKPLRAIAPTHSDSASGQSPPVPKRTKRSIACTACKARKSKCGGQPCMRCVETGTECIFDGTIDRRKKYAQRHAEQELSSVYQLLNQLVDAFDAGDMVQLGKLLSSTQRDRLRRTERHKQSFPSYEQSEKDTTMSVHSLSDDDTRRAAVSSDSLFPASVRSLDEVDYNQYCRFTDYICKESENAWMQKLETGDASQLNREGDPRQPPVNNSSTSVSCPRDSSVKTQLLPLRQHSERAAGMLSTLSLRQTNIQNAVDWSPDCIASGSGHGQQPSFAWDPTFFSVDM
ncbi:Zn(II)2Cys6 transcription factor domain-containing protein [Aspergillus undulatus]|uniref:Zn(II)2Cys6 transcription factor domain-containing protein n=1 Tax=Aspergillus undulatus TaxID=1810928 RepID=UPI003CCD40D3